MNPVLVLTLLATLIAGLDPMPTAVEAAPDLSSHSFGVIPGSGPAGQTVTATGSGWTPSNGLYQIYWEFEGGTVLGSFNPSGSGSWSTPITIPSGASAGSHNIVACEGVGGEFKQCATASYNVVPPTATITPIPTRTSTPTLPPGITPSLTPTQTPSVTPISGCIDGITRISPSNSDDLGGVETADLVMEVTRGSDESVVRVYTWEVIDGRSTEVVFSQWPGPLPGTTVDAVQDPADANRWTVTFHDYPLRLGYNQIKVDMDPTCWRAGRTYYQFTNGVTPSPTPRPAVCGGLGLDPDAQVINFDSYSPYSYFQRLSRDLGVRFDRSLELIRPEDIEPRSSSGVGASIEAFEFGSAMLPIRVAFDQPLSALGAFVGLQEPTWVTGEVTALLSVYGYRGGSGPLVELGRDSTSFPAEATDVIHCLRFEAEPGDLIARAHIEYLDSAGVSIAERRIIDDLTIVHSEQELPPDQPPIVEIESPTDGASVAGTTMFLRATIIEDREVIRVNYQIDGGPETALGASPSASDPVSYFTGANLGTAGLNDGRPHLLTVNAYDSLGQLGTDTITITVPTPVPTIDIQATKLEIVQTVQCLNNTGCLDNAVPLVVGKPTWIRLYVRAEGGPPSRPITGRVCRGRVANCEDGPVLSINSITPDEDEEPSRADRGDLSQSLNFIIPPSWLTGDKLEVTAFVNYQEQEVDEVIYENNIVQAAVSIVPARTLRVMFMPVTADGITAPISEMWSFVEWLSRVFPVTRIAPIALPPLPGDFDLSDSSGDGCGRTWGRLMDALRGAYTWSGSGRAYLYGLVPEEAERDGIGGCGERPGRVASGRTSVGTRWGAVIAAQELGHNFGRQHAPGCDAGNPDDSYPRRGALVDEWGIDLARRQIYPVGSSYDYMGYCGGEGNSWTSVYTYLRVMRQMLASASLLNRGALAAPYQASGEPSLIGGGSISPDGFSLERGFYRASLAEAIDDSLPPGPFTVQLIDIAGGILYTRDFGIIELSNHAPGDSGHVQLILPDIADTAGIVFLYEGSEITRIVASESPPEVELLSPTGGEDWTAPGTHTIEWSSSDPDGGDLRYNVQYSRDGGESWAALAFDLTGTTSLQVNTENLAGGHVLFRVLASDGLNTDSSTLSSPVSIASKPPMIHLASPEDGDWFPVGQAAVFQGFAIDAEDQIVDPQSFRWTSSLDGELGNEPTMWSVPLSSGDHEITLTVTDSQGQSASQSVMITVGGETEDVRAGVPRLAIVMVICGASLLGVALLGGAVYFQRQRGKRPNM